MEKAKYIMVGGFLGSGKSTAVARLARHFKDQGLQVGLITNDQGKGLVDTKFFHSNGYPVEEIAGGCFCCRFNSLMEAANNLSRHSRPDVFIAEPVGSCTDLVATVSYPLRRIYGNNFAIAPLSVLVDPVRASRILGLESGRAFSEKVIYVYRKQLEEANLIMINKCDLLDAGRLERLQIALEAGFPKSEVLVCSARYGEGMDDWFSRIALRELGNDEAMELDYNLYAEGESLLGWLNCTVEVRAAQPFDGDALLMNLAQAIQRRLQASGVEIAHLKMTLSPLDGSGELAVINLVRNDYVPELSQSLLDPVQAGQLILNLRAESSPDQLYAAADGALRNCSDGNLTLKVEHLERFRPGRPVPTYRIAKVSLDV